MSRYHLLPELLYTGEKVLASMLTEWHGLYTRLKSIKWFKHIQVLPCRKFCDFLLKLFEYCSQSSSHNVLQFVTKPCPGSPFSIWNFSYFFFLEKEVIIFLQTPTAQSILVSPFIELVIARCRLWPKLEIWWQSVGIHRWTVPHVHSRVIFFSSNAIPSSVS